MRLLIRKFIAMVITILAVAFLVFLAFTVIPGDPATAQLGTQATPERVEALREEMGLNRPFLVRFGEWMLGMLCGDMGTSYSYQTPVSSLVGDKIPITLTLTLMAFLMMLVISIPLGIYTARHEGGAADHAFMAVNQVIMAVPPFFSGILITLVFGLILRLFTPGGYISYTQSIPGFIGYLFFPALAIALPKAAMTVKLLRSCLVGEKKMDYARTAYSRGNSTKEVLYRHLLKNAMIPVITFLGMALSDMVAGSIVIEQVFNIPGLGRILLTSISNRDYPVVEAIIVLLSFLVIFINFLVDLIYRKVDPRIRVQ
ncbi:MAG TPA: ABC transporter permease [Candidatus Eisenbergiella merdipullorum]|uniref:ABC transporter permease n=1 Tax=Candidatus Eisenbergiella merdipullorum TaxID=2838553 RepID=A0A9D2I6H9_9FIRM|nr:ABC transporter permease [Candidatus Eisenbergiella merdipullorum]